MITGYCEHCGDGPACVVCGRGQQTDAERLAAEMVGTTRQHIGTRELFEVVGVAEPIGTDDRVRVEYFGRDPRWSRHLRTLSLVFVQDVTVRVS